MLFHHDRELILMRKTHVILSAVLFLLFAGCSVFGKGKTPDITGTWIGKAVVADSGLRKEYAATLVFSENKTMTLIYEIDGKKVTFSGTYTADRTKHPMFIDIRNYGFLESSMAFCCPSVAEFPTVNRMNISGNIGRCGTVSRPSKFDRNPSRRTQLCLEMTRAEE